MSRFEAEISTLEMAWNAGGFLDLIRHGNFSEDQGNGFYKTIQSLDFAHAEMIPRRLVSLLWYLPSFLAWQEERVAKTSGNVTAYKKFTTEVMNTLERQLGVP